MYIQQSHKEEDEDLVSLAGEVSCDGLQFQELARKAQAAVNSAKFSLRLACSPMYYTYSVWPSCKENPSQFKEDLRYLFTLLGQGNLKPNVTECINLEEVGEVQERIELLGKKGTVVCLPTALYEKKAYAVVAPQNYPKRDQHGFPVLDGSDFDSDPLQSYASDAGYVKVAHHQPSDTLSDFNRMPRTSIDNGSASLPVLPETSSYSNVHPFHNDTYHQTNHFDRASATSDYAFEHNRYQYDTSSMIGSVGQISAANVSVGHQTALSDGALKSRSPFGGEELPLSIQFRNKEGRRYRAYQRQKKAKETWKRSQQQQQSSKTEAEKELDANPSPMTPAVETRASYSTRKMRREARTGRGQTSAAPAEKSSGNATKAAPATNLEVQPRVAEMKTADVQQLKGPSSASPGSRSQDMRFKSAGQEPCKDSRSEQDEYDAGDFRSVLSKWKNIDDQLSRQS